MAETVYEQFREAAIESPELPFLCYPQSDSRDYCSEGAEFKYGDALATVDALAERYRAAGYGVGHRIAMLAGNRPEHFWHLIALNSVGACVVTLNPDYLPHEIAYGVSFPDCSLVLSAPPWIDKVRTAIASFERPVPVLDVSDPPASFPPPGRDPIVVSDDAGARPALIIYTSGTTGKPKGCIISNTSCLAAGESYGEAKGLISFGRGVERLYVPLPAFHMNVSVYTLNTVTRLRNCLIMQDRFSASRWWSDLVETRATCFHYLGIIPPLLVKAPPGPNDRRHQVRCGYGAGVDPAVREAFEERFGVMLIEAWGMTETSRAIQNNDLPRCLEPRAFGRPRAPWQVRVVDENDVTVPFDTPGELLVRAAGDDPRFGFFSGYLNLPEETEHAWRGGWFHTGDIVRERADGMLFFVDRRKNIIRRSGENIAAAEVEEALLTLPQVKNAAVLAVEDELHDEEVMACLVPMEGVARTRESAENIQRAALNTIGVGKLPAWIAFMDSLPVTGTQKVQKGQLFPEGQDPRKDPRVYDLRDTKRALRTAQG